MKSTEKCDEEEDGNEMTKDAQNAANGPKRTKNVSKYRGSATKPSASPNSSLPSSSTSSIESKMPGHAKCSSPKWDIKPEDRRIEPRSADSAFDDACETLVESPQEASPAPCQESRSPSGDTLCARDEDDENLIPIPPCISEAGVDALLTAIPHPPVTKESVEELELVFIQSNITLRIDINFDHDLHFTPVSGDKREQKKKEARKYYLSLEAELRIAHHHSLLGSCIECDERRSSSSDKRVLEGRLPRFKPRLPVLFRKLKELLVILVPDRDQYQISQYLDVPLLLQEMSHGLLDIVRLAQWLDGLLTSHCAPMRDVSAHEMAEKIRQGAETGDIHTLVAGIEMLFQILEAMKLDVANHQIRSFRYLLIDDTIAFQQEFFRSRIRHGDLTTKASRQWYFDALGKHQQCHNAAETPRSLPLAVLVHGMLGLCLCHDLELPATLGYDHKRLREIRMDIQDEIHLNISLSVFNQLIRDLVYSESDTSPLHGLLETQVMEMHITLRTRIMDITDGNPGEVPQIWLQHAEAIALELTRAASHICRGSAFPIPAAMVAKTTQTLTDKFEDEHQNQHHTKELIRVIEWTAHKHASKFQNMTTLAISHEQKHWQQVRAQRQRVRLLPEIEDIARRLAHIASIHWRVWADLVYLESEDGHAFGVDEIDGISGDGFQEMTGAPMDYVQHHLKDDTPRHSM